MPRPDRRPTNDRAAKAQKIARSGRAAERRRAGMIWGAAALVVVLIVGAIVFAVVRESPAMADLESNVEVFEHQALEHTTEAVEYDATPPVGGPHHPAWWNCGVYDQEIPNEHAVHSLEHGTVWLTYNDDATEEQIAVLEELGNQEFMLVSPYPDQETTIVASTWDHQMTLDDADEKLLKAFVREYKQGPQTPEPGAACTGGTTTDLVQRG